MVNEYKLFIDWWPGKKTLIKRLIKKGRVPSAAGPETASLHPVIVCSLCCDCFHLI